MLLQMNIGAFGFDRNVCQCQVLTVNLLFAKSTIIAIICVFRAVLAYISLYLFLHYAQPLSFSLLYFIPLPIFSLFYSRCAPHRPLLPCHECRHLPHTYIRLRFCSRSFPLPNNFGTFPVTTERTRAVCYDRLPTPL